MDVVISEFYISLCREQFPKLLTLLQRIMRMFGSTEGKREKEEGKEGKRRGRREREEKRDRKPLLMPLVINWFTLIKCCAKGLWF